MPILFFDQWADYPHAIVDTKTTNTSFLRLAAIYKKMGIKNHAFILQLHNPDLQGIDPFSEDLTTAQMAAIALECKENFFYFIREIAMAPPISGNIPVRFKANRGNIATYWLFLNHITTILIQIRQTGKSFGLDTLSDYLLNIGCVNTDINLLTKDDDLRSKNIQRIKNICDLLPFYLRMRTKADINNTEEVSIKALNNSLKAHLPNKSPKIALNVGRGFTSPIFFGDEVAFLFNIEISLPAALAAGVAARQAAKENDEYYGTVLATTAGKKDDRDGKYAYRLVTRSANWTEGFLDLKNVDELELVIRKNKPSSMETVFNPDAPSGGKNDLRVNCTFNHRQLGYTDEWLRRSIEETMVSGEAADRDFFNVWTSGSLSNPIPLKILELIRRSQESDFYSEIAELGYITRWYLEKDELDFVMSKDHYVMSLDTSEASGGDDISLKMINIKTGATVAAGNYNETNLITFSQWLLTFFVRFSNMTCVIERRSTGGMILDYLLLMMPAAGIDPFKRLFNWCVNDHDEDRERYKEISVPLSRRSPEVYIKYKKTFGFATSGSGATARSGLYSTTLQSACKIIGSKVKDSVTIDQLLSLTTRNGRVDHQEGGHDDMVIAFLLNFWLLTQGKNLSFYGINVNDIFIDCKEAVVESKTRLNPYIVNEQAYIRKVIEELYIEMTKERDEFIYKKLEQNLRHLTNKLILQDGERFSVDELIASLNKEKRFNRINRDNNSVNVNKWNNNRSGYI